MGLRDHEECNGLETVALYVIKMSKEFISAPRG